MLGLMAGTPQAAQGMALLVFPFTFVSSAYIPVSSMPVWMQAFASQQPVTYMVDAARSLSQGHAAELLIGHSTGYLVAGSLLWADRREAVLRGGPAPIPGCFVLMWQAGLPAPRQHVTCEEAPPQGRGLHSEA